MKDEAGNSVLKIFVSFFQLLGKEATDLLDASQSVTIGENKFGKVEVKGNLEKEITCPEDFLKLNEEASQNRTTATTFKNDNSSRSHALCKIRIQNTALKSLEDGEMFLVDLAGSESTADSQFHDKTLVKQTQQINESLMALKECIRNRSLLVLNERDNVRVPYRDSKLTMLLKESFELQSNMFSKTVVIANVAPAVSDMKMTINTLRFVAPLKVVARKKLNKALFEPHFDNPASWTNEMLRDWISFATQRQVDSAEFCPFETGKQILRI